MFTGLIEDIGQLDAITRQGKTASLLLHTKLPPEQFSPGDSLAVNGTCLTLEEIQGAQLRCHCLAETLSRTNLGQLPVGAPLNLERALQAGARLGGHFVSGHVDYCAAVLFAGVNGDDFELEITLPQDQRPYIVEKGSVAVNGVSLTVARITPKSFTLCIIPHTAKKTNLHTLRSGDMVNVETDVLGKYIVRAMHIQQPDQHSYTNLMQKLEENGFFQK